jgi:hypothetical protein
MDKKESLQEEYIRKFGDPGLVEFIDRKGQEEKFIHMLNKHLRPAERITNVHNYDMAFKGTNKENQYYILKEISNKFYNQEPHDRHLDEQKIFLLSRQYRKFSRFSKRKELAFDLDAEKTIGIKLEKEDLGFKEEPRELSQEVFKKEPVVEVVEPPRRERKSRFQMR